ncbi:GNAT family N-acetyltransferase [Oceanobacillus massiliensis]|uniref:GNAT family N-acetyltransferase n=1 Tax=Oceanobacillus massiliensis TaxID=1465765 RepID=UPI000287A7B6|nr:GNAT family N-acetyltransferase [Oceanobacillus massiliensis]
MEIKIVETREELEHVYKIRMNVFVNEQNVPPEEELDEHDATATHFIAYDNGLPVAASRLRFVEEYGKLERICVAKEHRGKSIGKQVILEMEKVIRDKDYKKAKLNAQTHAENFYKKLGYETISGEFLDAGIPHVTMVKQMK